MMGKVKRKKNISIDICSFVVFIVLKVKRKYRRGFFKFLLKEFRVKKVFFEVWLGESINKIVEKYKLFFSYF